MASKGLNAKKLQIRSIFQFRRPKNCICKNANSHGKKCKKLQLHIPILEDRRPVTITVQKQRKTLKFFSRFGAEKEKPRPGLFSRGLVINAFEVSQANFQHCAEGLMLKINRDAEKYVDITADGFKKLENMWFILAFYAKNKPAIPQKCFSSYSISLSSNFPLLLE